MHPARPKAPPRPCPACGRLVDPLRAPHVLAFEDGFEYACDEACALRIRDGARTPRVVESAVARPARDRDTGHVAVPRSPERARHTVPGSRPLESVLLDRDVPIPWLGFTCAAAALVLGLLPGPVPLAFASAGLSVLAAALAIRASVPAWKGVGIVPWSTAPAGAMLAAVAAIAARLEDTHHWVGLAGAAVAAGATLVRGVLDARARRPVAAMASRLLESLPRRVRVPLRDESQVPIGTQEASTDRIRAGEEVVAQEGDVVGVDGIVKAGEAFVLLFPSARTPVARRTGDPVLAGARVVEGAIRLLATRVGDERALVRPSRFGVGVGSGAARVARLAEQAARWGGFASVAVAIGGLALAEEAGVAGALSAAAAVLLATPLLATRRSADAPLVAAAAAGAERGIVFPSARVLENAGRVNIAALCSHGTVTEGEPEVVEVHAIGGAEDVNLLVALAAAAETVAESSAIGRAVRKYADLHGIVPESVRRATFLPGRGVTALSPGGDPFVIGNRQLLLDEGVSVAVADAEATRAEALGHTAVFVGLGGRVRAVLSLQDPIRPGARAAVQRLFDLHVEAVLVSGDHRATIEALARNLDVSHVKAELLPAERGAEVRRLRESGSIVATAGRPGHDDAALAAADVPVVLGAAGGATSDTSVAIATDDVRDAVASLWIAKAARAEALRGVMLALGGGAVLVASGALGFVPPALAAVLGILVDAATLPSGARLLRRIDLRIPSRP